MHAPAATDSNGMIDLATICAKVSLTPLGLDVHEGLTHDEWRDIGIHIGTAMRSVSFVIGDWLVYAEGRDGQGRFWDHIPERDEVSPALYKEASHLTSLPVSTLHNYAYVARRVPRSLRTEALSWEHHRKVAKLKEDTDKERWLKLAAKASRDGIMSTRRLARSIEAGRVLSRAEMAALDGEQGIETVHPYVNHIVAFFGRLRHAGWFDEAHPAKLASLKRDLQPVVDLYNEL